MKGYRIFLFLFLVMLASVLFQDFQIMSSEAGAAERAILLGPFGEPKLVADQFENFQYPIKVYSDAEIDVFIPDVTNSGWIDWFGKPFSEKGLYEVCLYTHFKKSSFCEREFAKGNPALVITCSNLYYQRRQIRVDTRNKTAMVLITYCSITVPCTRGRKYNT